MQLAARSDMLDIGLEKSRNLNFLRKWKKLRRQGSKGVWVNWETWENFLESFSVAGKVAHVGHARLEKIENFDEFQNERKQVWKCSRGFLEHREVFFRAYQVKQTKKWRFQNYEICKTKGSEKKAKRKKCLQPALQGPRRKPGWRFSAGIKFTL